MKSWPPLPGSSRARRCVDCLRYACDRTVLGGCCATGPRGPARGSRSAGDRGGPVATVGCLAAPTWTPLLAHREDLNSDLRSIIEKQTEPWGVEVRIVEIKDVEIPESMQRAMAREAEAERERRAKVINARGELQASEELRAAAETLSTNPALLQLRYLQTLLELGAGHNSTVVFPLPVDIITPFLRHPGLLESIAGSINSRGSTVVD